MPKVIRSVNKKSTFRNRGSQKISSAMKRAVKNNRLSGKIARG